MTPTAILAICFIMCSIFSVCNVILAFYITGLMALRVIELEKDSHKHVKADTK